MSNERAAVARPPGGRYAVLVVDDDPVALETTAAILEDWHEVHATTDVAEAFRILDRREIDVIVSDWRMPMIDGVEFLRRVMRRGQPIACLLVSGAVDELAGEVAPEQRKFIAVLRKPFSAPQLLDRVASLGRIAAMKSSVRRMRGTE
jgi:CheY-like chemotaxis protein